MSTFSTLSTEILDELADTSSATYYTSSDVTAAMQDGYDLIAAITMCIVKKVVLAFMGNYNYYDFTDNATDHFPSIYVSDFLTPLAIFNNTTHLWLLDDKTIRDFQKDRIDWENWSGSPVWWAPCNDGRRIALVPKPLTPTLATGWTYTGGLNQADYTALVTAELAATRLTIQQALTAANMYVGTLTGAVNLMPSYPEMLVLGWTQNATLNFDMYYAAKAPTIVTSDSPLFPVDFHPLIKYWAMYSLLADAQELNKSSIWWAEFWGIAEGEQNFDKGVYALQYRSKNIAKADLLMLA